MEQHLTEERLNVILDMIRFYHEERSFQRIQLDVENELLEKIRLGKYQEIHISPFSKIKDNIGIMAMDDNTSYTYLTVSAITLFSRTAIECGLKPDEVFDLSDTLLYFLSTCNTLESIHNVFQIAATVFAKRIYQFHRNSYSLPVERICNYVGHNIFHKIKLEDIAAYVGMSPNYLCSLFAQETGISLHNYIQKEKVDIACNLLMHTGGPISDVATYLGFQTPSNFAAVFKKWKKMTPKEYRKLYYSEVY